MFSAEVIAALKNPDTEVLEVRDLAREGLLAVGSGTEAIPAHFRDWRALRQALTTRQESTRRVAAISRWRAADIDNVRIADLMSNSVRGQDERAQVLAHMRNRLEQEISTRGDKRISEPATMATTFLADVKRMSRVIDEESELHPLIRLLIEAGLDPEDIDPSATFVGTMDLLIFHERLRIVANRNTIPWQELKQTVTPGRVPVAAIEQSMRAHAHDQRERRGSEVNDTHLLCLAPYADITYVDKRTLENVRRARRKANGFSQLVGKVDKANSHIEVTAGLSAK